MIRFVPGLVLLVACASAPQPATMSNHGGAPTPAPEAWSQPVEGVRARLIATPIANHQTKIEMEIENVSDSDHLEMWFSEPELSAKLQLEGESGPAKEAPMAVDYASSAPYWLVLPHGTRMRMTLANAPYEDYPGQEPTFRPVPFQDWFVPVGKLYLRGQLVLEKPPDETGHPLVFHGPIELPRIELPPR